MRAATPPLRFSSAVAAFGVVAALWVGANAAVRADERMDLPRLPRPVQPSPTSEGESGVADGNPTEAVAMFKRICRAPDSEWLGLGEAEAKQRGWQLDPLQSGRRYGVVASNDVMKREPPIWEARGWRVGAESFARLGTWVVTADWPMLKANSCVVAIPGQYLSEMLAMTAKALELDSEKAVRIGSDSVWSWQLEYSIEGPKYVSRSIMVSQRSWKSGTASFVGYIEYEFPKDPTGLPNQGVTP